MSDEVFDSREILMCLMCEVRYVRLLCTFWVRTYWQDLLDCRHGDVV